jgi:hypothetical protein
MEKIIRKVQELPKLAIIELGCAMPWGAWQCILCLF